MVVGHVHRDLDHPPLLQFEAQGLHVCEPAVLGPELVRYPLRYPKIARPQIYVVGDENLPGANSCGPGGWMDHLWAEVRLLRRVLSDPIPETLKLSSSHISKISPLRNCRRFLVEEYRNAIAGPKFAAKIPS